MYCTECGAKQKRRTIQGRTRSVCPACGRVAYQRLKVGAGVLVEREGALLLVRRAPGSDAFAGAWNLPAGYCEVDEPPPVTAAREAVEETGLRVQVGRLVDLYYFDDDPRGNGLLLVYEASMEYKDTSPGEWQPKSPEVSVAAFFPTENLPQPLCGGGHDRAIEAWRRRALDRWQPGDPMRFCPHCAHALEERPAFDRLRPVCPACGFVHFRTPKVGVSVLVESAGKVLLVQRGIEPGQGKWGLPAGFVEWDEAPEDAAARECLEETGLVVMDLEFLDMSHYRLDFRGPGINLAYSGRVAGGSLKGGDDAARVRWFSPRDLPPSEMIAFPSHSLLLQHWRQSHGSGFDRSEGLC